jgi:hypothetical protein
MLDYCRNHNMDFHKYAAEVVAERTGLDVMQIAKRVSSKLSSLRSTNAVRGAQISKGEDVVRKGLRASLDLAPKTHDAIEADIRRLEQNPPACLAQDDADDQARDPATADKSTGNVNKRNGSTTSTQKPKGEELEDDDNDPAGGREGKKPKFDADQNKPVRRDGPSQAKPKPNSGTLVDLTQSVHDDEEDPG